MTTPRRRLVRPTPPASPSPQQRRVLRLRTALERERLTLARWLVRLKRAFNAFQRSHERIARWQRQLTQMEDNHDPHD
jgi:hypothetical protein